MSEATIDATNVFGPLSDFIDDPTVEEIWINSPDEVFVYENSQKKKLNLQLTSLSVRQMVERMLRDSGRRLDRSEPFVDSTLSTPLGQRPLDFGVDIVLHSATKGIGGHNDALLGVIAGEKDLIDAVWAYSVMHGASPSPHDALNALRGLRTLGVRLQHQNTSALTIARSLESHAKVVSVQHPFLESHAQHELARRQMRFGGTVFALELDGDLETCEAFVSKLRIAHIATSFGGPETLVCHPATSTHVGLPPSELESLGVTAGLLRFSIGLEDADDLVDDIHQALASI